MWRSPSRPPRSMKAPKSVMFLTTPFPDLADQKLLHQRGALLLPLPFQDHPARNHDIPPPLVQLDDLEVVLLTQEVLDIREPSGERSGTRAGTRPPHDVHGDTSLDLPDKGALHGDGRLRGLP